MSQAISQCHKCRGPIGQDSGPPDGWQLEYGKTVCHKCCVEDTKTAVNSYWGFQDGQVEFVEQSPPKPVYGSFIRRLFNWPKCHEITFQFKAKGSP